MNEKTKEDLDAAKVATQNMTYSRDKAFTSSPHEEHVEETNMAVKTWLVKNKNWK